jgi:hypothetical protein
VPSKSKKQGGSKSGKASKSDIGKDSVEKGRRFEDAVADLYRLLGADVIQGVMICQKKVDVLATFRLPGGSSVHRVIIECKNERKVVAQNQRVMEFTGLLDTARKTGEADSAEIITQVPWSDAAKGFALQAGINILTYSQKLSQLIDFTDYLSDLINRFDKADPNRPSDPPLATYYVGLSAEHNVNGKTDHIQKVNDYIRQWLVKNSNRQHLAILGGYGAGKSSLCLKLAHDLAVAHRKNSHASRIPILISLRDFTKTLKIEALIASFLDEECGVANPKFKLFKAMNDAGAFLIIFDGFDEMAVRVDTDTLEANLQEIEKLATAPASKVILTSRPEYFISSEEEGRTFTPSLAIIKTREAEYEPIKLLPWEEKQIEEFLKKRVPLIKEATETWTYYKNHILGLPDLHDLSQRPVLLEMIVKTLPELIKNDTSITLNNLYELYLSSELRRQKILKRRALLLRDEARLSTLKNLALDIFCGDIKTLNYTEALERIAKEINPPRDELEAYTRDFLSASFLIRRGSGYSFSHKSILDYLVATKLIKEIEDDNPKKFGKGHINHLIVKFLVVYQPNEGTLWKWIDYTKDRAGNIGPYIGGNAASLLVALSKGALAGKDLAGSNLTGSDLSGADLRDTNLSGAILNHVNLTNAKFFKQNISSAIFSNSVVSYFSVINEPVETFDEIPGSLDRMNFFNLLERRDKDIKHITGLSLTLDKKVLRIALSVQVDDVDELETNRMMISSKLSADVAIYADEYERFEHEVSRRMKHIKNG